MKTAGIIGGLGPETTTRFYMEVILGCSKIHKTRPSILISNVALPLKMERELITLGKGEKRILPFLIESAKHLERGGADFIVIPCNTVHLFIQEVRDSVSIPVLSIIEETASFFAEMDIDKVGLLATQTTIKNHLFNEHLQNIGIKTHIPNKIEQVLLGEIIFHIVKNEQKDRDKEKLLEIIDKFSLRGIKNTLLACTDLQILIPNHKNIFDTMQILAQATIRELLK